MEIADAVTDARVTTEVIHVDGLTYTYPKATEPAVRGMDFTVGRGEIFGFLGPSGAGKSTNPEGPHRPTAWPRWACVGVGQGPAGLAFRRFSTTPACGRTQ